MYFRKLQWKVELPKVELPYAHARTHKDTNNETLINAHEKCFIANEDAAPGDGGTPHNLQLPGSSTTEII